MKLQTANCAGLRPSKIEPLTGSSLPDSAALTISAFGHADGEIQVHPIGQGAHLPLVEVGLAGGELLDLLDDDFLHDVHEAVADIGGVDDFIAEAVDDFALLVHHVVVFERALADLEVVLLDALLGLLDRAVEQRVLQLLPFFEAHLLHVFDDLVRAEQAHQVVLERDEEVGGAGVALARATAAQLAVDAAGLVALGADDVQAAGLGARRRRV